MIVGVSSLVDLGSALFSIEAPWWHHDDAARVIIDGASTATLLGEKLAQCQIVLACLARVMHHSIKNVGILTMKKLLFLLH